MTTDRFRAVLVELRLSPTALADVLGCSDRVARRWWASTNTVPACIAAWLETMSVLHRENPPPMKAAHAA